VEARSASPFVGGIGGANNSQSLSDPLNYRCFPVIASLFFLLVPYLGQPLRPCFG